MSIRVENIKPLLGSFVHVDKSALLDNETIAQCQELLETRGVLVFPRIGLTDKEQVAFTDRLGTRVVFTTAVPGGDGEDPDIYKITLDPKFNPQPEYVQGTFFWHMDGLNSNIPPPKATVFRRDTVLRRVGNRIREHLSWLTRHCPRRQGRFRGLSAVHSVLSNMKRIIDAPSERDFERWNAPPVKEHPLVWKRRPRDASHSSSAQRPISSWACRLPTAVRYWLALIEWAAQPDFYYQTSMDGGRSRRLG